METVIILLFKVTSILRVAVMCLGLLLTIEPSANPADLIRVVTAKDFQEYCLRQGQYAELFDENAYGWRCTDGKMTGPINMSQLCRNFTGLSEVIERLANMHDTQKGWECWSWKTGRVYDSIDANIFSDFCRLYGYREAALVSRDAYGWRCTSPSRSDGLSVTQVCHVLMQLPTAIARVAEYFDPYSWECWN